MVSFGGGFGGLPGTGRLELGDSFCGDGGCVGSGATVFAAIEWPEGPGLGPDGSVLRGFESHRARQFHVLG